MVDAYYFCIEEAVGSLFDCPAGWSLRCPGCTRCHRAPSCGFGERGLAKICGSFSWHSNEDLRDAAGDLVAPVDRDMALGWSPRSGGLKYEPLSHICEAGRTGCRYGGHVGKVRLPGRLSAGARIRLVAPSITPQIAEWVRFGKIDWLPKEFEPADLDDAFLVIAATSAPGVNEAVFREAEARGLVCNAVDDIGHCHLYYGAVVQRGDWQIAISTNGKSPSLAQRLRKEFEAQFGPNMKCGSNGSARRVRLCARAVPARIRRGNCCTNWRPARCSSNLFEKPNGTRAARYDVKGKVYLVGAGPAIRNY